MGYMLMPDIIQSAIPCKGGQEKRRIGKCLQYHHRYKGDSRRFCKEMFVKIAVVGTKSSMIYTFLRITFEIEQRYIYATSAQQASERV